jgi:hypothetical protein
MPYKNTNKRRASCKARRLQLKAEGRCQWCGSYNPLPSRKDPTKPGCRCAACKAIANKVSRDRMAELRPIWESLGLCVSCGKADSIKKTHGVADKRCAACADDQDETKRVKRERSRPKEGGA